MLVCFFVSLATYNYQAEKAKDKEENEEFTQQLDKDFTSLVQSGALSALVNKKSSNDKEKREEASRTFIKVSDEQVHLLLSYSIFILFLGIYNLAVMAVFKNES